MVRAGLSTRDCLREAIQRLSPEATRRHVFTHTGWREIDGSWAYLTAGGAVGRDGVEVDLGPELARYWSAPAPIDAVAALRASLALLEVAPLSITIPFWAAVYRAPLDRGVPGRPVAVAGGADGELQVHARRACSLSHFGRASTA